ncbi:alpha/beta fold hydrolase [Streptomyces sp. NPDC127166]|uniref:alpha/beta fold hydrolase n=1 Tax=Streptomyces sp. NPDC127166 TaxID=3345380 RepID=UPI003631B62F
MPRPALIPLSTGTPPSRARAAVLVLHGGRVDDVRPLSRVNLPAWQMRPFASAIAGATAHDGVLVAHVRYRYRGWNGADAHPVTDTGRALDELRALARPVPVVLVGHSLGGRAALRAAAGAEGAIEALMAELAAERLLDEAGVDLLGGVRQAFKVVRRTIERREPLDWGPSGIDPCMALTSLSAAMSVLLSSPSQHRSRPIAARAARAFGEITNHRHEISWVATARGLAAADR